MKLITRDLELPPFYEDFEFPSLCEGLYSKNIRTLFLLLLHLKSRGHATTRLGETPFSWNDLRIHLDLPRSIFSEFLSLPAQWEL